MNGEGPGEQTGDRTGHETDDDRTIAVVRPAPPSDEDRTVAVRRVGRTATDTDPTVVARPLADDDLTVVVPRSAGSPKAAPAHAAESVRPAAPLDTTQPIDTAERRLASTLHDHESPALDPQRRIAAVPGAAPWERGPAAVPGLHQGLPLPYAPRSPGSAAAEAGPDEVQRRVGPPPGPSPVVARGGRETLPSLERRERRARRLTLIAYPLVIVAASAGLLLIAILAFG